MLPSLRTLRSRLQGTGPKILDAAIPLSGLEAALCARYGHGLTVKCENESYALHLPDIATDSRQACLLQEAVFPNEESLLRLRRRTRPGMIILEACSGCGARSIFYAKSMQAGRVYALGGAERDVSLSRKNILLNDLENVARPYSLQRGKSKTGTLDSFCRDQKITKVDLISLDEPGLAFAGLEGAEEILRQHGPAIIVWGQGSETAARTKDFLAGLGYAAPEAWTPEISFWVTRI